MERPRPGPRGRVGLHLIVQGRGWQSAPTDVAGHTQGVIVFQLNFMPKTKDQDQGPGFQKTRHQDQGPGLQKIRPA